MTKRLTLLLTALILTFPVNAMAAQAAFVNVNGLVCDFCARALEKVFGEREEVSDIHVNLDTKIITVTFNEQQNLDNEAITALVTDAGYNVEAIERGEAPETDMIADE